MPKRSSQSQHDLAWELEVLARWKKRTVGVREHEWDGSTLILSGSTGREIFDRPTVEAVIFNNFGRNVQ